jgi:alpha-ketoglutarate-dependent taurine dioxygenase
MTIVSPGPKLGAPRRKGVNLSDQGMVETGFLGAERSVPVVSGAAASVPLVVQPTVHGVDLTAWAGRNRERVEQWVLDHGAVLFRGFEIETVPQFEAFISAVSSGATEYRYRSSPRTQVGGNIYTSTDYPADQSIFPHNEHAYSPDFPLRIFFFCITPAARGGETPIGDCRRVLGRIDPEIRERFRQKGILYVRNFGDGLGLPWPTVFQTHDRALVEDYCREHGLTPEWKEGDRLRTRRVGPAIFKHPRTGEEIWFNHAAFYHWTTLEPSVRDRLIEVFGEEDLPNNTFYGDGTPIEPAVAAHLREAYLSEMVYFPWQKGDLLMADNMLVTHARAPYEGERKVVVGMAEICHAGEME